MKYVVLLSFVSLAACAGRGRTDAPPGDAAITFDAARPDGGAAYDAGHDSGRIDLGPRPDMGPPTGGCLPHTCPSGQVCANGYCAPPPDLTFDCGTNPFSSDDMCGTDGVCMESVNVDGTVISDRRCFQFGPCPADGRCPISTAGATCNIIGSDQLIGMKGAICLAGFCRAVADCPTAFHCIFASSMHPGGIGYCSDGALGSLCNGPDDCDSGLCMQLGAGSRGSCM